MPVIPLRQHLQKAVGSAPIFLMGKTKTPGVNNCQNHTDSTELGTGHQAPCLQPNAASLSLVTCPALRHPSLAESYGSL